MSAMTDNRLAFAEQEESDEFIRRHIGPSTEEQSVMLKALGYESLDALIDDAVPPKIRSKDPLALPPAPAPHSTCLRAAARMRSISLLTSSGSGSGSCSSSSRFFSSRQRCAMVFAPPAAPAS